MDKLVRCISVDGTLVMMAAETTDMVEKAYFIAKEGILELDKEAVILINDVYQSEGIE